MVDNACFEMTEGTTEVTIRWQQRRLADVGTSFDRLLEETRRDL